MAQPAVPAVVAEDAPLGLLPVALGPADAVVHRGPALAPGAVACRAPALRDVQAVLAVAVEAASGRHQRRARLARPVRRRGVAVLAVERGCVPPVGELRLEPAPRLA